LKKNCNDSNKKITDWSQGERTILDGDHGVCTTCLLDRARHFPELEDKLMKIITNLKEKKIWEQIKSEIH